MATAETARLIASLELKDQMSKGIDQAVGKVGKLEGTFNRIGGIAQRGVGNAIRNIERLGLVAAGALTGAVAFGIHELADLQRTQAQTNAVIASTGGKAGVSAAAVGAMSKSLESLSTVDEKVIQDGQNMLLTFTGIGKDIFPEATKATLNMAVAMAKGNVDQVDMQASAIRLGKALNDPVKGMTALRKVGVAFNADQIKQIKTLVAAGKVQEAQKVILRELNVEFGNAAKAAGTGPGAAWRRLQETGRDLSESLARGLIPVLTKASDWLSTKLADPAVVKTIDEIGAGLGRAGESLFAFIQTVDFKGISDSLGVAVGFAGNLVKAFLDMPSWVQVAVITGWGLNKLTGGAVGSIVGELAKGLIKGVLGINAGVVNVNAASVNGGLPGVPGAAGKGGLGLISKVFLIGEAIGLAELVDSVRNQIADKNTALATAIDDQTTKWLAQNPSKEDLINGLNAVTNGINQIQSNPLNVLVQGEALDKLTKMQADIKAQLDKTTAAEAAGVGPTGNKLSPPLFKDSPRTSAASLAELNAILERGRKAGFHPTIAAAQATNQKNLERIASAQLKQEQDAADALRKLSDTPSELASIRRALEAQKAPTVNVTTNVNVTAAQVTRSVVVQNRFGPSGGSRERGPNEFG